LVCCHYLDVLYVDDLYETQKSKQNFSIGSYIAKLNGTQYYNKNFVTSLIDGLQVKSLEQIGQEKEAKWSDRDLKNKTRILNILKDDPFIGFTDIERKYMFNLCSDYLVDENITEDPHKLQGVVEIVKTLQQVNKVDDQINLEIGQSIINDQKVKTLTTIKTNLLSSVNTFAKENGLSASLNSKGLKGSGSLAYQVKMLDEINFIESEINLFDITTCEAMKQQAQISNDAILNTIHFRSDELGEIFEEQTRAIFQKDEELSRLREENRKLKIKLKIETDEDEV
jgi:hypothetical protein